MLQTYDIEGERLMSSRHALNSGVAFLDSTSGAQGLILRWEGRPWVVILSEDVSKVVTTCPTNERPVINRLGDGRWRFPSN